MSKISGYLVEIWGFRVPVCNCSQLPAVPSESTLDLTNPSDVDDLSAIV